MTKSRSVLKSDFLSFAKKCFVYLEGDILEDEPYVAAICSKLDALRQRELNRLIINLPPRHLKTFHGAVCLSAWELAHNPRSKIMTISYNGDLAKAISEPTRKILNSTWFKKVFETRISDSHSRMGDFETTLGGGIYAVSVDGAMAGRGANLIIFDDPIDLKNWNNKTEHDRVSAIFDGIIKSRFNRPVDARIVVIAHCLSPNDLSHHILKSDDNIWERLALPFIATEDQSFDIGFELWSRKKGELLRPRAYSPKDVQNLQTHQIAPPFGLFYQQGLDRESILTLSESMFPDFSIKGFSPDHVILSIDTALKAGARNSFNVIQSWGVKNDAFFLLDQWRAQSDYTELKDACWSFLKKWRPCCVVVEPTANGPALISAIRNRHTSYPIYEVKAHQRAKVLRLKKHFSLLENGKIHLRADGEFKAEFLAEAIEFPGDTDDQIDAMTNLLDYWETRPKLPKREAPGVIGSAFASRQRRN